MNFPHKRDELLSKYTSYRIGGPAKILALPRTPGDLREIAAYIRKNAHAFFILGNGSNVLAPDEGFDGVVICTRELMTEYEFLPENRVRAGAGVLNARLLRAAAEKGLTGLEFLSGVPGNIGGAIYMNAGTATGWIETRLLEVDFFSLGDAEEKRHPREALKYSYREQHFLKEDEIILGGLLQLVAGDPAAIAASLAESAKKRKAAQPLELPSCGSVFRNPPGKNAWKLISDAGLRGRKQGGARISEKHSNFIVNEGGATKEDVLFLVNLAKESVRQHSGVELQEEIMLMSPRYLRAT